MFTRKVDVYCLKGGANAIIYNFFRLIILLKDFVPVLISVLYYYVLNLVVFRKILYN